MNSESSAWSNLIGLFHCLGAQRCALVSNVDSGFGIALVIVLGLNIGGVVVTGFGIATMIESVTNRGSGTRTVFIGVMWTVVAVLWFYFWLAYALPESIGLGYAPWMVATPLFTVVLIGGIVGTIGMAFFTLFIAGAVARGRSSGTSKRRKGKVTPFAIGRIPWALVIVAVTGLLIGWHHLYGVDATVAAGPFGHGPGWFQDALGIWPLHLPITFLWYLAKALATTPGLLTFAALGLMSVLLPSGAAPGTGGRNSRTVRAVDSILSTATTTAVVQVSSLVIGVCVAIVVALLLIAAVALAFMFFAAYFIAYAMVLAFLGMLLMAAIRH